ncbi:hypothetical protein JK628_07355 [Shewanella sp. KX20019]|uniref:hypothetical protein n=1 Tax=Shewanella sp. KX20019 TaxID=2803864 RepID=UPI001928B43B|nr:hypothetical protein [Shewanella sp. KX20019]QQX81647.1 hypothetical protein JK628_07355 [Shewanella sp. KX20019]
MISNYKRPSLRDDPRVNKALLNMPGRHADSYSEIQLVYFRHALMDHQWQRHFIDTRGTFYFPFIGWRFFYVFLLGRNKRALNRKEKQLSILIFIVSVVSFIVISIVFGLILLYLLKSALGIDLFENSSLGIWDWFNG